jgi:hypothetical protein
MTAQFQPPLSPITGSLGQTGNYGPSKNPFYSVANQWLPRNLQDVIRWARYITIQSPVVTEVIRKMATYPITEFVIDTKNPGVKVKYEELIRSFNLKSTLHNIGFEYHTVGNVFVSIYFPIQRTLTCPNCKSAHNALNADFAKFVNYQFEGTCPTCNSKQKFKVADTKSLDVKRMNVISWDPMNIQVNHNPITNEAEYYYKIPNEIRRRVKLGDKLLVNSIPMEMISAIQNNQDFKFEKHTIFHLKNISAGHMVSGIAVPPLISQFGTVFYQTTLKKANESIATDFMTPLRVIFPQGQTANSDPVLSISMRNFAANMTQAVKQHRQDNNHVLVAPVPIGYQSISGEGKGLLVSQEIRQAEETLLLSMGVSMELLSGSTNWTSSTVGLRMLENTLNCFVDQIENLVSWIFEQSAKYLGIDVVKVELTPFRLTDDDALRQILLQMSANQSCSATTLFESMGMDYEEELEKIKNDAVLRATYEVQTQLAVERARFVASKPGDKEDAEQDEYKAALTKAQQIAEQLAATDPTTKRQVLNQLRVDDYPMYLMTSKLLEQQNRAINDEAKTQEANQSAMSINSEPVENPPDGPSPEELAAVQAGQEEQGGGEGGAAPKGGGGSSGGDKAKGPSKHPSK